MLNYTTNRQVVLPLRELGLTYNALCLAMVSYFAIHGLYWSKEYQMECPMESSFYIKAKGNLDGGYWLGPRDPSFVWSFMSATDFVSNEDDGGIIILTDIGVTQNQTQDKNCPESEFVKEAICQIDSDCKKGVQLDNGVATGKCVHASLKVKTCEIGQTWCPVGPAIRFGVNGLMDQVENFTVEVRNSVSFPQCGPFHGDNLQRFSNDYLLTCLYDSINDPFCPNFRFGDIVNASGYNFTEVGITGGLFQLRINWNCDFDWSRTVEDCLPKYKFSRIDNVTHSPGFVFNRGVSYNIYKMTRTIVHYFGIKITIDVSGSGKKFSAWKFISVIGSLGGLFTIATFVCDSLFKFGCFINTVFKLELNNYKEDRKYNLTWATKDTTYTPLSGCNEDTENNHADDANEGPLVS